MDATLRDLTRKCLYLLLFGLGASGVGCGQKPAVNSATTNGANCPAQVIKGSFLVKWINGVPVEYEQKRLHPHSLITRFRGSSKAQIERDVLAKHVGEFILAEHEFNTEKISEVEMRSNAAISSTNAWGPSDINAQDAWTYLGKKGEGIVVAVIDSGVDLSHPLLQNHIWVNAKEIPNNGIDDDHDGYVDDYNGFDFNGGTGDPSDSPNLGHGTHVAGIISGQAGTNNFTGIAPGATIMPLKFIDSSGSGAVGDAITAMDYAVAPGAKVINASWGGNQCSSLLKDDISTTVQSGTVFANAAGNNGNDITIFPEWPAAYQAPGKITIASYNLSQFLSSFSNYGQLVDLAAPGENILSTVPPTLGQSEGQLALKSGTSMATPMVAGVAALLFSARPQSTAVQIADAINNSVIVGHFGVRTGGKINALTAAKYLMTHP